MKMFFVKSTRPAKISWQLILYLFFGSISAGVNIVVFYGLSGWVFPCLLPEDPIATVGFIPVIAGISDSLRGIHAMINAGFAFLVSNTVSYITNVLYIFEQGRHHYLIEMFWFYFLAFLSLLVANGVMWGLINFRGVNTTIALIVNIGITFALNFIVRKVLIFRN